MTECMVYRMKGQSPDTITSGSITAEVQSGALVITAVAATGNILIIVYGPGQWLTMNETPI